MLLRRPPAAVADGATETRAKPASLALGFATFERPHVAQRLIRSARRHFPDLPIYVADQSLQVGAQASFYERMGAQLVRMDFDAGVCASRNALVAAMEAEYFVLCDDDFILGPRTSFAGAARILERHADIGVVGGRLYDYHGDAYYLRNWELYLLHDPAQRLLTAIPIDRFAPQARELGALRFFMCDAVMNFAVFRRSIFSSEIRWDERFKSNGEHEDFFLNLKRRGAAKVCYLPTMVAYHHHPQEYHAYRHRLRDRTEGWRLFMEKWGIDQHLEIGGTLRSIADISQAVSETQVSSRFYMNADLALRPPRASDERLGIREFEQLVAVAALDAMGEPRPVAAPAARLLLDPATGRPIAVPERQLPDGAAAAAEPLSVVGKPRAGGGGRAAAPRTLLFRYDCVARDDADFVLWYHADAAAGPSDHATLDVVLRWWDGPRALVWHSEALSLDLTDAASWQPLLVDVPAWPPKAAFLRFEVLLWTGQAGPCLGIGFLGRVTLPPAAGDAASGRRRPPPRETFDVQTLRAAPAPGGAAGHDLTRNADQSASPLSPHDVIWPVSVAGLLLLRLAAVGEAETVFLTDWPGTGASLVRFDLPPAAANVPAWFALPRPAASAAAVTLFRQSGADGGAPLAFALPAV